MVSAGRGWQQVSAGSSTKRAKPKRAISKKVTPKKSAPKTQASKKATSKKTASKKGAGKGDPVKVIMAKMTEMYEMRIKEVDEAVLLEATGYSRHDSKGYRNAIKEVTKERGWVEKTKTIYTLTDLGLKHCAVKMPDKPKSNEEHHKQLLQTLEKLVSAPKAKLGAIFELLQDGKLHSVSDLLEASEYGRADSKGYRNIMSGLKKLGLLEKEGKDYRFSDKAFTFGRP